jgi:hypothetical protein
MTRIGTSAELACHGPRAPNARGPVAPLRPVDPLPPRYEQRAADPGALPVEPALEGELIRAARPAVATTPATERFAMRAQAASADLHDHPQTAAVQGAAFYRYMQETTAGVTRHAPGRVLDYFV